MTDSPFTASEQWFVQKGWLNRNKGATKCAFPMTSGEPCGNCAGRWLVCSEHEERWIAWAKDSHRSWAKDKLLPKRDMELDLLPSLLKPFPTMPFADVANRTYMNSLPPVLQRFIRTYAPGEGTSLLKLGVTGAGKTSSDTAMARRVLMSERAELESLTALDIAIRCEEASTRKVRSSKEIGMGDESYVERHVLDTPAPWFKSSLKGAVWVSALDLVLGSQRHPLGKGPPPIIEKARKAPLLFVDDLGQEMSMDRNRCVLEVLEARYQESGSLPTVANSALTKHAFIEMYGAHIFRRLAGQLSGKLIDLHEVKGGR